MTTTFDNKLNILADLWLDYKNDDGFQDFVQYNDLGLPLAYLVANNAAKVNNVGERLIEETWDLLLAGLGIKEDTGFENLDELLDIGDVV